LGVAVSKGKIQVCNVGLGRIIKDCAVAVDAWQHGGNTLLGTAIMLSPIAVAAGMTPIKQETFKVSEIRKNVKLVVESTTPEDAVNVYEAIKTAKPGGLGASSELDINDPNSINRILEEKISLYQIFRIAEKYDMVCSEWVNNYPVTFDAAYPSLTGQLEKNEDLNHAIVYTFLKVLAKYPDTLVARKAGIEKAREVSTEARKILSLGFETSGAKKLLSEFDKELRRSGNLFNPGTTADIIAAALALTVLSGYRP
jgi:triphosphoribosyl-dephospho-CoA synthase